MASQVSGFQRHPLSSGMQKFLYLEVLLCNIWDFRHSESLVFGEPVAGGRTILRKRDVFIFSGLKHTLIPCSQRRVENRLLMYILLPYYVVYHYYIYPWDVPFPL